SGAVAGRRRARPVGPGQLPTMTRCEGHMSDGVMRPGVGLQTPTSYADQIARILEGEILAGRYARGEHLQQDEVCRRFGVSRTPAREALRKLQALGLVQLVPNKGALIQMPTLEELRQTYEVRAELEGFAASLAARHRKIGRAS